MFYIGEVFWLEVEYEDTPDESKRRPAIIVGKREDSLFILVSTTTQSPKDPPSHFDQFKIPIHNWRRIGLPQASWGLGYRLIEVTENELKSVVAKTDIIGYLSENDLQYLITQIERIHN